MALSPKDVERFNHFCAVNVMILERLRIAFRFAHDETDVIMEHPHIEQEYKDINERWEKFDLTRSHEEFYASETYMRQLLLLYVIQVAFLQVLIPLLASIDIRDEEGPTPEMLYQPYNGDISNFNKEEIEMLYKCIFIMVPFVSAPAIETVKEKKTRFKKMNDAIKAKHGENDRARKARIKAEKEKAKQAKNTEAAAKKRAKRESVVAEEKEKALKKRRLAEEAKVQTDEAVKVACAAREKKRAADMRRRENETEEARLKRWEADRIAHEKCRANETDEAYKQRIDAQRVTQSQSRADESDEVRNRRLEIKRATESQRRQNETDEAYNRRIEAQRVTQAQSRAGESDEVRKRRLEIKRATESQRRENETNRIHQERLNSVIGEQAALVSPDEHSMDLPEDSPTPRVALHQEETVTLLRALGRIDNGLAPNVALHETEEIQKVQSEFCKSMADQEIRICSTCSEYKFLPKNVQIRGEYECAQCKKDKKKQKYSDYSAENDMNPGKMPSHLPKLSTIEEMLIAKAEPVMTVYRLTNGSVGHKGHVCTFNQDLEGFCEEFPRKVGDLDVVLVKKKVGDAPPKHADFSVNRKNIQIWLAWLKENHHCYRHMRINTEALRELPTEGNVASQLFSFVEEETGDGEGQDVEMEDAPTTQRGPEQGGASGNDAEVERVFIPSRFVGDPRKSEEEDLRDTIMGTRENPLHYPATGEPLSEFRTPHLQAMTFPTLFPYGIGDVTCGDRKTVITLTQSNHHLTRFAEIIDGKLVTRFASHPRWAHWAQNMAERHRMLSQRNVYLKRHPDDALMTEDELLKIVSEGGIAGITRSLIFVMSK